MIIINSTSYSVVVIVVAVVTIFSMIMILIPIYGQEETTTTNSITGLIKNTAEKIKNIASEVANNTTGILSPNEGKNILNQLGEATKRIALSGTDVLSNITGEIKENLR
jgi:predicted PurR-regulated permease PerM